MSVTVNAVNAMPVANNQSITTDEDTGKAVTLTGSDADGDSLTYSIVSNPSHGSLSGTAPNVTYMPATNYSGSDSFTFKVNDGTVDSAVATVSVTVNSINDAPVAVNDTAETNVSLAVDITVLSNDSDVDGTINVTSVEVNAPSHGVAIANTNGTVTFTPDVDYVGMAGFTYRVKDNEGAWSNYADVNITVKNDTCWVTISDPVLDVNQSKGAEVASMIIDKSTDTLYVAWTEGDWGNGYFHVKSYDGSSWSSLGGEINSRKTSSWARPVIKLDNSDKQPFIFYYENNGTYDRGSSVNKWETTSWNNIYNDSSFLGSYDMVVDSANHPITAHCNNDNLYFKQYDGSTWSDLTTIDESNNLAKPTLAIKSDDTLFVAYYHTYNYRHSRVREYNSTAGSWNSLGSLESNTTNRQVVCMSMIIDKSDHLTVAYVEQATPNPGNYDPHVFVKRYNGTSWDIIGDAINGATSVDTGGGLEGGGGYNQCISLAEDSSGDLYVAWQHVPIGQQREIHTQKYDGTTWTEAAKPLKDTQKLRAPSLVIDSAGRMNISALFDSTPNTTDMDDIKVYRCEP